MKHPNIIKVRSNHDSRSDTDRHDQQACLENGQELRLQALIPPQPACEGNAGFLPWCDVCPLNPQDDSPSFLLFL